MSSLIAHTAWYYLVSRYPVTSLSPITLLSPLFGIFFGVTLLNDQLTAAHARRRRGHAHRRVHRRDAREAARGYGDVSRRLTH